MSGIQAQKVLKYAVLPGIIPRLKKLFASGFGYLAFLMAQIYAGVRLIPANHPYTKPANIGEFGIHHVIALAANNLVLSKKNWDQIAIFILLLFGIVILACQIALVLMSFLSGTAQATSIFVTPNPDTDVAFILLDQVFGLPTFFGSCIANNTGCQLGNGVIPAAGGYPWPFHIALHQMFRFYSLAMLLVGILIVAYFVVVIVAETASTGSPFGQRFQNVWVPIRLIVAIGLLIPLPIAYGSGATAAYNSGQYITFFAAKTGSSLATNAWRVYNETISQTPGITAGAHNPLGESQATLIGKPSTPGIAPIAQMASILHTCAYSSYMNDDRAYSKVAGANTSGTDRISIPFADSINPDIFFQNIKIKPYFVKTVQPWMTNTLPHEKVVGGTSYEKAMEFYEGADIRIRFGILKDADNQVEPTCGDVIINVTDRRAPTASGGTLGAVEMQMKYFNLVKDLWFDAGWSRSYLEYAANMTVKNEKVNSSFTPCALQCQDPNLPCSSNNEEMCFDEPTDKWKADQTAKLRTRITTDLNTTWDNYTANGQETAISEDILKGNWANAGTWFPTIARVNGGFLDSVSIIPRMSTFPEVMEEVRERRRRSSPFVTGSDQFNPNQSSNQSIFEQISIGAEKDKTAITLSRVYTWWVGDAQDYTFMDKIAAGGGIKDIMNGILGTQGLYNMRENKHIHPLAQLATLGKGLVEASIRNVAISTIASGSGGLLRAIDNSAGKVAEAVGGFFVSTAFIGLSAGIVLFYIVPFLPFLYFYFAVASWVKTIFEAMVGVPLWALAHLRIDGGEGLPGEAASNGYFLIFEVFLRPVLTLAGLIAAMTIFTAQAHILNAIWSGTVENVGGMGAGASLGTVPLADQQTILEVKRDEVDQFFFTIIYAIVIYMAATASFKLVDTIPDNILRWAGQGVSSFGDINQDAAEGLTQYAALGGITSGRQLVQGTNQLAGGLGGSLGQAVGGMVRPGAPTP